RVVLSDGSSFHIQVTSPRPLLRLAIDPRNSPVWLPALKDMLLMGAKDGELSKFKKRFSEPQNPEPPKLEDSVTNALETKSVPETQETAKNLLFDFGALTKSSLTDSEQFGSELGNFKSRRAPKVVEREAVVKYEPTHFRDSLLALIPEDIDLEKFWFVIEQNAEKLEYKRYGEPFFELFIVGGLLAPGGNVVDDGARRLPHSIFEGDVSEIKAKIEAIGKLTRRYKYLQRKLEDTLSHLLQYVNKFGENTEKLSTAVGYLITSTSVNCAILSNLIKDHLVKDGVSLQFVTNIFKVYLEEQSIDHLASILRKSGIDEKLLDFFPPNKRQEEYLARHFEAEGLNSLVQYYKKRQQGFLKETVKLELKDMFENGKDSKEIVTYAKQQLSANSWNEPEFITLVWDAMITAVDWGTRPDQVDAMLLKQLNVIEELIIYETETATPP
ncbi:hypothetical protein HK096_005285, partial [Nowakowskiella sp. JEL0078]